MPPSGICAIVPRAVTSARFRTQRGSPSTRRAANQTATVSEDPDERHQAVAELDCGVAALLRIRLVAAARPVVASEARGRQPNDCPARDDDPEGEDGGGRELDEAAGGDEAPGSRLLGHAVDPVAADLHPGYRSATPEPSRTRPIAVEREIARRECRHQRRRPCPRAARRAGRRPSADRTPALRQRRRRSSRRAAPSSRGSCGHRRCGRPPRRARAPREARAARRRRARSERRCATPSRRHARAGRSRSRP